jgi:hypothetical protein
MRDDIFFKSGLRDVATLDTIMNDPQIRPILDMYRHLFDHAWLKQELEIVYGWTVLLRTVLMRFHGNSANINRRAEDVVYVPSANNARGVELRVRAATLSHVRLLITLGGPRIICIRSSCGKYMVQFRQMHCDAYALSWELATRHQHGVLFTGYASLVLLLGYSLARRTAAHAGAA